MKTLNYLFITNSGYPRPMDNIRKMCSFYKKRQKAFLNGTVKYNYIKTNKLRVNTFYETLEKLNPDVIMFFTVPKNKQLVRGTLDFMKRKNSNWVFTLDGKECEIYYITDVVPCDFKKTREHSDRRDIIDIALTDDEKEEYNKQDSQEQHIQGQMIEKTLMYNPIYKEPSEETKEHYKMYIRLYDMVYPRDNEEWTRTIQQIDFYLENNLEYLVDEKQYENIINNYEKKPKMSMHDRGYLRYSNLDYLISAR